MTYSGMQLAGCAAMFLAGGIGIGVYGLKLVEAIAKHGAKPRTPEAEVA